MQIQLRQPRWSKERYKTQQFIVEVISINRIRKTHSKEEDLLEALDYFVVKLAQQTTLLQTNFQKKDQVGRSDGVQNSPYLLGSSRKAYETLTSSTGSGRNSTTAPRLSPQTSKNFPHEFFEQKPFPKKNSPPDKADDSAPSVGARESPYNVTTILPPLSASPV